MTSTIVIDYEDSKGKFRTEEADVDTYMLKNDFGEINTVIYLNKYKNLDICRVIDFEVILDGNEKNNIPDDLYI